MTGNKLFHTLLVMTGLDVALHGAFFAMELSSASTAKQLAAAIDKVLPGKLLEAICDADETLLLLGRLGLLGLQRLVGLYTKILLRFLAEAETSLESSSSPALGVSRFC